MKKQLIIALSFVALVACEQQTSKPASTQAETSVATPTVQVSETAVADSERSNRSGKVIFNLHCAGCHDPGNAHAATKQLAIVRGKDLAVLRQRTDLVPVYIKHIVRDGLLEMPPFRPTDINTEELDNLANYIVDSAKAYQAEGAK